MNVRIITRDNVHLLHWLKFDKKICKTFVKLTDSTSNALVTTVLTSFVNFRDFITCLVTKINVDYSKVMPSFPPSPSKFGLPFDITEKLAFQYCNNPKDDRPTSDQVAKYQFIIVEDWFCYPDFQNYHGPSNLAHVIRFSEVIENIYAENGKAVCVRTSPASTQRSNVALLISTYLLINCSWSIADICERLSGIFETVLDYRTEGEGPCDHRVSIHDCLFGLEMAFKHLDTFDLTQFEVEQLLLMEQPRNGDMNWIVPGRLVALAGPTQLNWPIEKFVKYASDNDIGCLVRLNRAHYQAEDVTRNGDIEHVEMFMHDGTNPTAENIRDFIVLVDRHNSAKKAVAVHCRAGLGRTGTMIAAYLLFSFAREASHRSHSSTCPCKDLSPRKIARALVGFLRIMRPGSVLSGQPEFLESIAAVIMEAGRQKDASLIDLTPENIQLFCSSESVTINISTCNSSTSGSNQSSEAASSESLPSSISSNDPSPLNRSKRLKLLQTRQQHPISHAGRGHAAEKRSNVKIGMLKE